VVEVLCSGRGQVINKFRYANLKGFWLVVRELRAQGSFWEANFAFGSCEYLKALAEFEAEKDRGDFFGV
jgi:hypothetical protein